MVKNNSCQHNTDHLHIYQIPGNMFRTEDGTQSVNNHQGGVKHIQVEHIGSKTVIKIPESESAFPDMADNGVVMLQVLLDRIRTNIKSYKYPEFIAENVAAVNKQGACQE